MLQHHEILNNMKLFKYGMLFSFAALLGCTGTAYKNTDKKITDTTTHINRLKTNASSTAPPIVNNTGYYVDSKPIPLDKTPLWLKQPIRVQTNAMPFNLLIQHMLVKYSVNSHYDRSIAPKQLISIKYAGTIEGALNTIAQRTNYYYSAHSHNVNWSAFETRTFSISFMPENSNHLVDEQNNQSKQINNNDPAKSLQPGQLNNQPYSNMRGNLSPWQDLRNTLNQLKSSQGNVIVSKSTASVTVHDRPDIVRAIARYISELNYHLNQQVAIKIQVLKVHLNRNTHYGIDWNLVANTLRTQFHLSGSFAQATNAPYNMLTLTDSSSPHTQPRIGFRNGSQAVISALNLQGKVQAITEPELVTTNNRIASLHITQNVSYIHSITQSQSENFLTTAIKTDSASDGLTLYILPKIQKNKVYMQISSTLANLERLEKISNSNPENKKDSQSQKIQVPAPTQKSFNQRSVVRSGSTLIIADYKKIHNKVSSASLSGISSLKKKDIINSNFETLVLITPLILHSS